uniref:Uncharacterized protein n=1 Tax=Rhizophora mucronata TaxID=61149 RepID=A0A2P2PAV1_RHIMU
MKNESLIKQSDESSLFRINGPLDSIE